MGCTTSATNTLPPTPQANATDTEEKIHVEQSKQLQTVAIIELPKCDTVNQVEVAMVANNNESSIKESLLLDPKDYLIEELAVTELDNQDKAKQTENHDHAKENTTVSDEKIKNMEDIVGKVVELYITDSIHANGLNTDEIIETPATPSNGKHKTDTTNQTTNEETEQAYEEEELSSVVSPSQSQSSRATRWEALADIAAELPPSLTVDPLTGQIYALSK